ncbi:MAG: integrase [Candidatus Omnitrophota bacterium]
MSPRPVNELLEKISKRYIKASRIEKSLILNEFCANHSCHRKSAIRTIRQKPYLKPKITYKKKGRPCIYRDKRLIKILEAIWSTAYFPCSKRLKACIPLWLPYYEISFGSVSENIKILLLRISTGTIDNLLTTSRLKYKKRGRSTTKPGTLLRNKIPIKTDQWNEFKPGFMEFDTVAHCGESVAGQYVNTVDAVDIASGWSEQRAVWGKGEAAAFEQIKDIEDSIPFPFLGFDSDNGGEFINYHLWRYFVNRKVPAQFTRSRAYKKNDNSHIEQKNWTHVRQWFGYGRFENPKLVPLLNNLYKSEWRLFHNFFCPSVKLIDKKRIGSKTIKIHDKPKTPYQRLIESEHVSDNIKELLTKTFKSLNPFELRKAIMIKIKEICRYI